ncbi:MAG: class I SAM-dependent methyltransferase [Actinomycetes bacterium]
MDRIQYIVSKVEGLRVCHVGFADVGCECTRSTTGDWLHERIVRAADSAVGLDIVGAAVTDARTRGYEAHQVDCTDPQAVAALDLGTFDLVVAGEVIEHLEEPGSFLRAMKALVRPDGRLLLTTPNAYRPQNALLALTSREWVHPDHVVQFSPRTLTVLLERCGWDVVEGATYLVPRTGSTPAPTSLGQLLARTSNVVQRLLAKRVSPYVADGLVVVASPSRVGAGR